eukprot:c28021_g2_i1 orf=404-1693(-)
MTLKSLVRELKEIRGGIGSISGRNFEVKISRYNKVRSQSLVCDGGDETSQNHMVLDFSEQRSCWSNLPPEMLREVLQRIEASESAWPARRHVVACAAVCRKWREIIKELVKIPEESGKLTFPISLKQSGPRDTAVQCFIKRNRANSSYHLYLGLTPNLLVENGKFLLAARKFRRATSTDYIISLHANDMSRGSSSYLGKLRSNFLGTKFTIFDSQPSCNGAVLGNSRSSHHVCSKQVSPSITACAYNVAHIDYELNVLGTRGPRRMQCTLYVNPAVMTVEKGEGNLQIPTGTLCSADNSLSSLSFTKPIGTVSNFSSTEAQCVSNIVTGKVGPLILKNKAPRWHEQLQCWCLNFKGRVTVASVKNFQLVAAVEPEPIQQGISQSDADKVVLQFGKVGKDTFTMDYRYPLSAFQAFAICLSSFDTKLACE